MIVLRCEEEGWLEALEALPTWVPDDAPMLVVVPHPDDETLGAGGLIAAQRRRGVEVTFACVTDGEHAYPDEDNAAWLGKRRVGEQTGALERLGAAEGSVVRLGLVDSDVSAREEELVERLAGLAAARTLIVAPWEGDFHPDHEACGRAGARVAAATGARLISYFFWTWHRGIPADLQGLDLVKLGLGEETVQAKAEALAMHRTQLGREGGEPILPERLLKPMKRNFEVFALR